ncbi:hypothetical protein D3C81_771290 [compost metagenome]
MIIQQINADKNFTNSAANNMETRLRNSAKEVQAEAEHIQTRIDNYNKLIQAMSAAAGAKADTFAESVAQGEKRMAGGTPLVQDITGPILSAAVQKEKAAAENEKSALDQRVKYLNDLATQVEKGATTFTADIVPQDMPKEKTTKPKTGKTPEELAAEKRKVAYEADLKTIQFQSDFYDLSAEKQIQKYEALRKKHAQFMKESVDDARTLTLQIKRLQEDSVDSRFEFSTTTIDEEMKRMEDAGKSEKQMANQRLYMWNNVRSKYSKDSEQYKKADEEVRQARKDLAQATANEERDLFSERSDYIEQQVRQLKASGKSEKEISALKVQLWLDLRNKYKANTEYYKQADEQLFEARQDLIEDQKDQVNDFLDVEKDAIKKAKDADLAAIEERKQAKLDEIDAEIDAIQKLRDANKQLNVDADYATQLAEKQARLAVLQSAVGPEGIEERDALNKEIAQMQLEHERELTDRALESQQQQLQDEKTEREKAFDKEKSETEAQYDTLLAVFDSYSGDIQTIESGIAAFRVSSAGAANTQILSDLDTFLTQYKAKMAEVTATQEALDLATYNANKDAWTAAKAAGNTSEMARLQAENQAIRDKYGITKDTGEKLQHFADGGVVQGTRGQAIPIVAHGGEIVLNPQQQAVLWDMIASPRIAAQNPTGNTTQIVQHIDLGVDEVTLTDKADISTFYDERARVLERLQAMGVKE